VSKVNAARDGYYLEILVILPKKKAGTRMIPEEHYFMGF